MKLLDALGPVSVEHDKTGDVLDISFFGGKLKTTATVAYEDLLLIHLGRAEGAPVREITVSGITIIGFEDLRRRIHGPEEEPMDEIAADAADALELEFSDDILVVRDRTKWVETPLRLNVDITPTFSVVNNVVGEPVAFVLDGRRGFQPRDISEILGALFDPLFEPEGAVAKDPTRAALGRAIAERVLEPLLTA